MKRYEFEAKDDKTAIVIAREESEGRWVRYAEIARLRRKVAYYIGEARTRSRELRGLCAMFTYLLTLHSDERKTNASLRSQLTEAVGLLHESNQYQRYDPVQTELLGTRVLDWLDRYDATIQQADQQGESDAKRS